MGKKVKIVIQGLPQLALSASRVVSNVEEAIKEQLHASTMRMEKDAKREAPVDTGRLRSSISREVEGLTGVVSTSVEYAEHVEFGTSLTEAQPFMQPAAEAERKRLPKELRKALKDAVKER